MPKRVKNQSSVNDYFKRKQDKIIDALDDAGVVVPAGILPVTRLLTPAQKLREKELRDELHRLKLLEDEYREEYNRKKDEWTSSRKELVDQLAAHDESYKTEIEPDEKLLTDDDANIKAIEQQQQQQQQQTGPGPAETTPEEAAAKAQRRRELMEEIFRLEDEYIDHLLNVEEKQRRWNEQREVLVNALAAVDEYIRLQEENGWEDETEDA
ncbi:hypothetical protein AtubIFM54640_009811 [Aspergillus tubingensis]|nr:hypothetical protein AtubIFM54640_009811 [Aspergillus tubingensis]